MRRDLPPGRRRTDHDNLCAGDSDRAVHHSNVRLSKDPHTTAQPASDNAEPICSHAAMETFVMAGPFPLADPTMRTVGLRALALLPPTDNLPAIHHPSRC